MRRVGMEKRNKQYQIMKCKNESGGGREDVLQEIEIYIAFHKKEKAQKSRSGKQENWKISCDDTFPWIQGY